MNKPIKGRLQEGISAAKRGLMEEAAPLLASAANEDPSNEVAWYWLGLSLTSPSEKAWCFRRTLKINPYNVEARQQLDTLAWEALHDSGYSPEEAAGLNLDEVLEEEPAILRELSGRPLAPAPIINLPPGSTTPPTPGQPGESTLQDLREAVTDAGKPAFQESGRASISRKPLVSWAIAGLFLLALAAGGFLLLGRGRTGAKPTPATAAPAVLPVTPTLAPSPTLTRPAPTPSASPTPFATPTLTIQRRIEAAQGAILIAEDHLKAGRYAEALLAWNNLVKRLPDYGLLYVRRAETIFGQAEAQAGGIEEYWQGLDSALEDLDRAVEIDPALKEAGSVRARIEMAYARSSPDPDERSAWFDLALQHASAAAAAGAADEETTLIPYYIRIARGDCRTTLEELKKASPLGASADTISTGWHTVLANAYMCTGDNRRALKEIDQALVQPTTERLMLKAMIFYNTGSYQQAAGVVDGWIKMIPSVRSDRYFLRALAYLERGDREAARLDLMAGQGESWDPDGIGMFVEGRLAAFGGDSTMAARLYRKAEERMRMDYATLRRRLHNYLVTITGG